MVEQPSGTLTLVFTDIEGSTRLLGELGREAYREALDEHRRVVREACSRRGGYEVDYEGDSFFYAFGSAREAVAAVEEMLRGLESGPIRIRVGVHTGEPGLDPPKYVGIDVHLAARVMAAGHGGQTLLTRATRDLLDLDARDLGEHRLKDIPEPVRLYQLGEGDFAPLRTLSNTNLPIPLSSFLGRERELEQAEGLLEEVRLVTISGPGGAGKTRFAIELASRRLERYPNGVFWVPLAPLRDPALVLDTAAAAVGAKNGLADHVGSSRVLLVLDNMEQVVEAAPVLSELLSACPQLSLVVTSRELLRIEGEVEFPLPPLADTEAHALFCARARCQPTTAVAELCARLDGLPLAIELAAARMAVFTPEQLLDRLGQRLDLLKGGRDADPRQRTLRATIEWSYDLLDEQEQTLFRRLSVFRGGWALEAAEDVAGADPDLLQSLVEKSLVRHSSDRFWMLETIRNYAEERLTEAGEVEAFRRRHLDWVVSLAQRLPGKFNPGEYEGWSEVVRGEQDNVRGALDFAEEAGLIDQEAEIARAWAVFWARHGPVREGRRRLEHAVEHGVALAPLVRARLQGLLASLEMHEGDFGAARVNAEEFLRVRRELGDPRGILPALEILAAVVKASGSTEEAIALYEEYRALARELGDRASEMTSLGQLAQLTDAEGDYARAAALAREAFDIAEDTDDRWNAAIAQIELAFHELKEGGSGEARLREALLAARDLHWPEFCAAALVGLATSSSRVDHSKSARLVGAADAQMKEVGIERDPYDEARRERVMATLEAAFEAEELDRLLDEGRAMKLDEAVEYALGP
ncbi:MAG TPA: adenylate/guanylate cyclase domain-containing protein [Gaiellaceae bacterium]|nr:adenylate/guanylate cyclase domain-containing protein [Gaiellaceae bacterium]